MVLHTANYANNGNLYVGILEEEDGYYVPWSDLTVNLNRKCKPGCAFIDTNNNGDEIEDWLMKNNLAYPTGRLEVSGWCIYPEFKFNMETLMQYVLGDQ